MMKELRLISPIRTAAIMIILVISFFILSWAQEVIVPLLFAMIFSVILFPLCLKLEQWRCHKGVAAFISVLAASLLMAYFLSIVITQLMHLVSEGPQFADRLSLLADKVETYISNRFHIEKSIQISHLHQQLNKLMDNSSAYISSTMSFTGYLVSDVVLIFLFSFFLLYFRIFFLEFFYKIFPASDKELIDGTMGNIYSVIQNYLLGLIKVICIIGAMNSLGLWLLGIESPLFFGFLGGILVIIPYIGILMGMALPVLVALITKDSYWYAVGVMAVFFFIHVLEGNLITPLIVGSKVSINPVVVILSLLLFGKLWGLPGLVLAIPVTAICKVIFDSLPGFKAIGFLLGRPQKYHFKRYSKLHARLRNRQVESTSQQGTPAAHPDA